MKVVLLIAGLAALSACSTIEGAGQDMQTAGQAVTQEARKASNGV